MTSNLRPSRWAYLGLILGGLVSVAANIAHSFIAPKGAPENWTPEPGAVVSAIVWPLFLFIAIEILARTPWPNGWGWDVLRWVGLPPVALVAAFVSYQHLSGLLRHYDEGTLVIWFGPVAVDGLMLMATAALLAAKHRTDTRPSNPAPALVPATSAPASSPDITADAKVRPAAAKNTTATNPIKKSTPAKKTAAPRKRTTPTKTTTAPKTTTPTESTAPAPTPVPDTTAPATPATKPAAPAPAMLSNARIVATAHEKAHGEPITPGQLAVRLRVPTHTAADILTALTTDPSINDKTHNGTAVGATA
ncbi:DUF2637 domain-containing protein [Micromonospora fluostatini]|uniref:DUF2637 domain-containing protein n=1 Tax=Micromonospora sp. JCM 30529 TaxID=3421643 RepID=UPI003D16D316